MATMGSGAGVSCDASRLEWARSELAQLDHDQLFTAASLARISTRVAQDGQFLAGPGLKLVCAKDDLRPAAAPEGVQIEIVDRRAVSALYRHHGFRNALSYSVDSSWPDMVAAVARVGGEVVGIAGASADSETMWQVGVDVVEGQRRRGIGRAIVSRVTGEVLARGRLPYYSTVVSNLDSSRLALAVGYRLGWVELYTGTP